MEIGIVHIEAQIQLFKLESLTVVRESKLSSIAANEISLKNVTRESIFNHSPNSIDPSLRRRNGVRSSTEWLFVMCFFSPGSTWGKEKYKKITQIYKRYTNNNEHDCGPGKAASGEVLRSSRLFIAVDC